ncbi:MAG: hypothetical protein IPG32_13860, partial [Saprospirales bacterium]|nr:hypothetical protein [Saprospirales bacterium]
FYKTIITFQLLIFYFTVFGQENIDANQMMEFSKETIIDYFQVELEEMDTIYFLTDVKNDNGIIIFSLAGLEFGST